ncbi:MAG TPA: peptide-methionine (S)-S-oxide reductase MsrA [Phycisphaerae bacterium]|nr:peptide-methionine (S)-S-oxide reductase MsrA [Phycisphaerae bacterium]
MRVWLPLIVGALGIFLAFPWSRAFGQRDMAAATMPTVGKGMKEATFAAGCFWGVQQALKQVPGVVSTTVGYTGGTTVNPTYGEVCTETTHHAEAVLVVYDPAKVSYAELLDAFWSCHDPTTKDRQGPDVGDQYRSAIFTHDAEQARVAKASLEEVDKQHVFADKIVTEIVPAGPFYPAEGYHQDYAAKEGVVCHTEGPAKVRTQLAVLAAEARKAMQPG